ncbi:BamA/TamA family outer membrane protein [Pontibacter chitinilyticus]|uniref:BamA/TamA family outer membrane protein n=1 Tax=Pontibacter chitinilyticus TaxID=2674989 RepID=UPI0032196CCB
MVQLRFCVSFFLLMMLCQVAAAAVPCDVPAVVITSIRLQGNETTRNQVLLQELTFAPGDTIATAALEPLLEDNRRRLFNLRLFHTVAYTYTCNEGQVVVTYQVQERFYLYPIPILDFADRNFNAWLEKKDWSRIDYGVNLIKRNFRGRNEDVRLWLQRGFNRRLEVVYRVPYISRSSKLGLEVGAFDYRSRTISYTNRQNRQAFFEQQEGLPIRRTYVAAALLHRQSVQRQEALTLGYHTEHISDSVVYLNPAYYGNGRSERQYLRLDLTKVINLRNTFAYPLSGSYFEAGIGQTFFLHHSGTPYTVIRAKYADYTKLADKLYYAAAVEGQVRLAGQYAFADNVALGFRSLVRGYELYVVGGQHYGLFKQGLSRQLVDIKGIRLNFIDNPKFNRVPLAVYLNAFTDAGYVADHTFAANNPMANRLLVGGGLGLHVVTFYDIVLRMEYAVNREGDRGLYLGGRFPF